jgi:hypothetical protein
MRKNLETVPLYAPIARVPAHAADEMVATGRGRSLRGRALLIFDRSELEDLLMQLDLDPQMMKILARGINRLRAERAAAAARVEADRPAPSTAAAQSGDEEAR